MSDLKVPNLDWIRGVEIDGHPGFGAKLYQSLHTLALGVSTIAQQTNANPSGTPEAPPPVQQVTVTPHPQGVDVSIKHEGQFYQGLEYYVDYADNPSFVNARTEHIGQTRNAIIPVGQWNGYYQVRASYPSGISTRPVLNGGAVAQMVRGGSTSAVAMQPTQGCGVTLPGQPPGFGNSFRSDTGAPPKRKS